MEYCLKCGAYIPDFTTKCLACGYDKAASASAVAYETVPDYSSAKGTKEYTRPDYTAEARKEKENRDWAREEYTRHRENEKQAARAQSEEYYKRSYSGASSQRGYRSVSTGSSSGKSYDYKNINSSRDGIPKKSKLLSYLSYFGPFCFIPLIAGKDEFTKFHGGQGLNLFIVFEILTAIFGKAIAIIVWLFYFAVGIQNINAGSMEELPIFGKIKIVDYIKRLFNKN